MGELYEGREQTGAKHYILERYLQELVFKILRTQDVAYVDGFSGPWESKTGDFSDTSFMIAIKVLKDAQQRLFETTGTRNRVRCFFSEKVRDSFIKLEKAVQPFNNPEERFEIVVRHGEFTEFSFIVQRHAVKCIGLRLVVVDRHHGTVAESIVHAAHIGVEVFRHPPSRIGFIH